MPPTKGRRPETVIVVDDEPLVLSTLAAGLSHSGFQVLSADCGRAALDMATRRRETIEVMVCDVILPDIDGPELAAHFRSLHPETQVLFVAGYAGHPLVVEQILARGLPFLEKPFLPRTLAEKVLELCGVSRAMAAKV